MTRTRSHASARKAGTAWESEIVRTLIAAGWPHAERRAKTGALDKGDITGVAGVCIEAKSTKAINLAQFVDEAAIETVNAKARIGVAWIKRRGKAGADQGYVAMTGATFMQLLREAGY